MEGFSLQMFKNGPDNEIYGDRYLSQNLRYLCMSLCMCMICIFVCLCLLSCEDLLKSEICEIRVFHAICFWSFAPIFIILLDVD